jgi:hypothetical protein
VARAEWPGGWPRILELAVAGIAGTSVDSAQHRGWVRLLAKVLEALASRRIGAAMRAFQELPPQLLPHLLPLWRHHLQSLGQASSAPGPSAVVSASAVLSCVAALVEHGFREGSGAS